MKQVDSDGEQARAREGIGADLADSEMFFRGQEVFTDYNGGI